MHWQLVQVERDSAEVARESDPKFHTSPRVEDMSERAQEQSRKVYKMIQLACKSDLVGPGKVRINASGYAHHDAEKMPSDQRDFIAISIGRIG